ncbi:MAG: hypothetical protein K8F30_08670 [Taibaiella sp.]|nr:hypothetical protein [Taibaiella sp.]
MNYDKLLEDFHKDNPINGFIEHGYSPEQIKEFIITRLSPFIHDRNLIKKNAIDHLVSTWVLFEKISLSSKLSNGLKEIANSCDLQTTVQKELASELYVKHMSTLDDSTNKYWSTLLTERKNRDQENLIDFAVNIFSIIGHQIEFTIKPYLQLYICVSRIQKNNFTNIESVFHDSLGKLTNEFNLLTPYLLTIENVPINHWRNIAYHNDYRINNEVIECFYGHTKSKQIILNKNKLHAIAKEINLIGSTLKVMEAIFIFNNLDYIQQQTTKSKLVGPTLRKESQILDFYAKLSTQGFRVVSLTIADNETILTIEDITNPRSIDIIRKRKIHSSQFLFQLWIISHAKLLKINYKIYNREISFYSTVNSDVCKRIYDGNEDISYLAKKATFTHL